MDLNGVFRQCTPCTLYSTTLTVQCTYGAEQCVQTVYTVYTIKYNIDSSVYIWTWTVCSDSVHRVHYIVQHWQFRVHMDLNSVFVWAPCIHHVHYIGQHWQFSVHMDLNSVFRQCTPCTIYSTSLTVQSTYGPEQCVRLSTMYTPCALYRTTLAVQCTYGPEQCVQTVYTICII